MPWESETPTCFTATQEVDIFAYIVDFILICNFSGLASEAIGFGCKTVGPKVWNQ